METFKINNLMIQNDNDSCGLYTMVFAQNIINNLDKAHEDILESVTDGITKPNDPMAWRLRFTKLLKPYLKKAVVQNDTESDNDDDVI